MFYQKHLIHFPFSSRGHWNEVLGNISSISDYQDIWYVVQKPAEGVAMKKWGIYLINMSDWYIFISDESRFNIWWKSMFQLRGLLWSSGEYIWWLLPLALAVLLSWSPGFESPCHGFHDDDDDHEEDDDHDHGQFGDDCRPDWGGDFIVSPGVWPHVTHW